MKIPLDKKSCQWYIQYMTKIVVKMENKIVIMIKILVKMKR